MGVEDYGLPEIDPGEYMIGMMFEVGPLRLNGENICPTDWDILTPFGQTVGLETDDLLTLSRMCVGYHEAWREGENPLSIPPTDREG